ncbi:MAG: 30S ribosomal protein THX [Sphingobacteriaceae bacterium]|nr:30S ribosomal protein THX [Sphingobacteriaceae bacterium]
MGKGDKKSKRGKITMGSFGKKRPHKLAKKSEAVAEEKTTSKSA